MPKPALPPAELDTIPQFAARTNTSVRNIYRAIADGRVTVVYVGNTARIDPVANMARIKRERPPAALKRGRPRKGTTPNLVSPT
jgi:hypothetical protein